MIGKTVSHHRILEKLSAGRMIVAYCSEDSNHDRQVSVKVLFDVFSGNLGRRQSSGYGERDDL